MRCHGNSGEALCEYGVYRPFILEFLWRRVYKYPKQQAGGIMSDPEKEKQATDDLLGEPEPWESWESKLVGGCIITAVVGLVILGWLINTFILN